MQIFWVRAQDDAAFLLRLQAILSISALVWNFSQQSTDFCLLIHPGRLGWGRSRAGNGGIDACIAHIIKCCAASRSYVHENTHPVSTRLWKCALCCMQEVFAAVLALFIFAVVCPLRMLDKSFTGTAVLTRIIHWSEIGYVCF